MSSNSINPNTVGFVARPNVTNAVPGAGHEGRGENWQREMERAQMALWLSHGVIGHQPRSITASPAAPEAAAAPVSITGGGSAAAPSSVSDEVCRDQPPHMDGPDTHHPAIAVHLSRAHADAVQFSSSLPLSISRGESKRDEAATAIAGVTPMGVAPLAIQAHSHDRLPDAHPFSSLAPAIEAPQVSLHASPPTASRAPLAMQAVAAPTLAGTSHRQAQASLEKLAAIDAAAPAPALALAPAPRMTASVHEALTGTRRLAAEVMSYGPVRATTGHAELGGATLVAVEPEGQLPSAILTSSTRVTAPRPAVATAPVMQPGLITAVPAVIATQVDTLGAMPRAAPTVLEQSLPPSVGVGTRARDTAATRGAAPTAQPSPIRLHADWSADGIRLWLGMDTDMLPHLAAIAAHLQRWVAAQGLKVLSLSCNGKDLDEHQQPETLVPPAFGTASRVVRNPITPTTSRTRS